MYASEAVELLKRFRLEPGWNWEVGTGRDGKSVTLDVDYRAYESTPVRHGPQPERGTSHPGRLQRHQRDSRPRGAGALPLPDAGRREASSAESAQRKWCRA